MTSLHFAAFECTYVKYQITLKQREIKICREEIRSTHTTCLTVSSLLSVKRLKVTVQITVFHRL